MIIYNKDKQILYIPENDDAVILGWDDIYQKGFRDGYQEGYDEAYEGNYQSGYTDGYAEGIVACHVDATSITLDIPSVIVGSGQADVIVEPVDADVELIFTSSDPSIATIDENGHITVIEDGEVTFCVEDLRSGLQDCQTVSVEKPYFMVSPLSISAPASGGTYTIRIASNYPQEWSINGSSWITISPSSGTGSGNVNVTIQANEDTSRSGSIFIMDGSTTLSIIQISQEAGEEPYFRIIPTGTIWFEKSGGTINLTIDTNMDIPWRVVASSDDSAHALTASPTSGTGYGVVALSVPDVGCDASIWAIPREDGLAQFQNYLDIYTGSTLYESQKMVFQKTWLAGDIVAAEILDKPDVYPASGGTYTIKVRTPYGASDYPNAFRFKDMLGTATYSHSSWTTSGGFWEHYFTYVVPENTGSAREVYSGIEIKANNSPCTTTYEYENYFGESQEAGEEPSREIYVQTLIDEGYANVVTGAGGTYIEILPTTPYSASQVLDLGEVARNEKQLTGTTNNIIVWNQELPNGWTNSDITSLYTNKQLNFSPRGEMLWALGDVDSFEITFSGGGWIASDYPWGSYQSEGVFAPRWNQNKQAEYISKGFLKTPKNLTVNLTGSFSSVSQVMFTQIKSTTALTINQEAGTFACHDVTGMFEGDNALVTLNITGAFNYGTWRTQHNVYDGCTALTGIPYSTSWTREHTNNTIYPHADGVRGSANCRHMFRGCTNLTYLGPTFNMGAISLSGCTYDGQNQAALTDTLFDCPALTDVRIINMNNNDWNFSDSSTFTYIPAMSVASIEYLLNNAADVNSQGGHTVTFHSRHMGEVSQSAIDAAAAKGWNVVWDGDSPTPDTGYSTQYLTIEALESGNLKVTRSNTNVHFNYSVNGGEWVDSPTVSGSANYVIIRVNEGDTVRFKGNHSSCGNMFEENTISCNAYGNVSSMIYGDDFSGNTVPISCARMFENNTGIVDASNLVLPGVVLPEYEFVLPGIYAYMFKGCTSLAAAPELPATTLGPNCYYEMFVGCTNLEDAPALPATELTADCYYGMFSGCTSLATAPELPATTLASDCYEEMFHGCTSLTTAPELPATILASKCYMNMFVGCTSLATAPELSATTLVTYCYNGMFYGCSSLNYVKCLATDISAEYCTYAWLNRTASTGTFVKAVSMNDWVRNESGVPSDWTIQNA